MQDGPHGPFCIWSTVRLPLGVLCPFGMRKLRTRIDDLAEAVSVSAAPKGSQTHPIAHNGFQ